MAHSSVIAAVETRLVGFAGLPILKTNEGGDIIGTQEELMIVQYPVSNQSEVDMAERVFKEEGTVRFVLLLGVGSGTTRATQLGEQLGTLFRRYRSGRVRFGIPSTPFFDDTNDDGSYFKTTVVVDYWLTYTN